jgi:hypothetical protein
VGSSGLRPLPPKGEAGFGLVGIVISLMIVAILSVGALKAFASGAGSGSGSPAQSPAVNQAYDVQAQSALSNVMENVRDGAIGNGGVAASDLAQYGISAAPSMSPSEVSGAVAGSSADGSIGFGGVTLAVESKSRTCWFVWFSSSSTWYGSEPDATSCAAQPMADAPTAGAASSGSIGWQQGSFPISG